MPESSKRHDPRRKKDEKMARMELAIFAWI